MRRNLWVSGMALAAVLVTTSVTAQPPATPPAAPPPQGERPARPGRHPHIQAATRDLERAEKQLEKAAHHYNGHRSKALELVKQAEKELQEGLKWAEAHPEAFATGQKKP
ncbi:MAG TPA: hypothetical protein VE932_21615 [Patescibacteria group bacterium]|nr:hypothetical protein [Patescibacteria group bacterium]